MAGYGLMDGYGMGGGGLDGLQNSQYGLGGSPQIFGGYNPNTDLTYRGSPQSYPGSYGTGAMPTPNLTSGFPVRTYGKPPTLEASNFYAKGLQAAAGNAMGSMAQAPMAQAPQIAQTPMQMSNYVDPQIMQYLQQAQAPQMGIIAPQVQQQPGQYPSLASAAYNYAPPTPPGQYPSLESAAYNYAPPPVDVDTTKKFDWASVDNSGAT